MSVIGNEFSGLPIAELIGGPLEAACKAQVRLAMATAGFIERVGFNPALDSQGKIIPGKLEPRQVDFSYWQPLPVEKKYKVTGVTITKAGSGYTSVPTPTFSGPPPGGTRATGTAIIDAKVASVTITDPGSGYTSAPKVTFDSPPPGGTRATGDAVLNGIKVASVTITDPGSGYTSAPKVTFDPLTGTGNTTASGNAIIDAKVASVTITDPGSGYTSAPKVTFDPPSPGGTRATGDTGVEVDTSLDSATNVQKVMISVPLLAIVNIPALMVKTVDIVFDMEVKSSESHKDTSSYEAGMEASAGVSWGPFSAEVKIHGSVSAHQENTRSTDRSAKYHVQVQARDDGMPEGLSRILDILQKAIEPVSVSKAVSLQNANIGQKAIA